MIEGLYSSAAGMEAQQNQLDAISNDLANMSTAGYQASRVGFRDLLYSSGGSASGSSVATGAGAASAVIGRNQQQGSIQQTGQPLDVALQGPGYLQVRRPDGTTGLTRNGTLQLNAQGRLTTDLGMPLEPPVTMPKGTAAADVEIGQDGTVRAGTKVVGRLAIVDVPGPDHLLADGSGVFSATAASGATRTATGTTVQQGAIEASNVDVNTVMAKMMEAQRGYSLESKAIQYQDQMLQIANQVRS
jgi:flagellar basal-body rod protein FlgG